MSSPAVAVIGSGISGLSAAWMLSQSRPVTVLERQGRIGGHSNTIEATTADGPVPVDTGFIVYNEANYPNFTALLAHLGVASADSSMGFAVSVERGRMEYCGRRLNGLFGQRRNIVRLRHWQLVSDILRFFRSCREQAQSIPDTMTIREFLERFGYSEVFVEDHILPISAAIWSTPLRGMLEFPARTFIDFFANHGLLQVANRPQWRTVVGGSRTYVQALAEAARCDIRTGVEIAAILRHAHGAEIIYSNGQREHFDQVVFACQADEALRLLGDATPLERSLLSAFRFTDNRAVLHTDPDFMPRRRHIWSSWNYLRSTNSTDGPLSLTYWMNSLQPLPTATDLFVTLNPMHDFAPGTVQREMVYRHPLFDAAAVAAQRDMWRVQGAQRTWFAGAWMGYGFHEDGLQAGLEVAERLGRATRPWRVEHARARIAHNWAEGDRMLWAAE